MHTESIVIDRGKARELYRAYKAHLHYSKPIDREVMRAYQLLAQGRLVIKALESVATAGQKEDGTPKLAIARADADVCRLHMANKGAAIMTTLPNRFRRSNRGISTQRFEWPEGTFPKRVTQEGESFGGRYPRRDYEAKLPLIPINLRPKRGLQNYHVLWEAEWSAVPPVDPMLLRRIGKADLWTVVAMWDLTEIERAALATRV